MPAMILVIYLMLTQSLSLGLTILVALPITHGAYQLDFQANRKTYPHYP